jgi:hypothetical protein
MQVRQGSGANQCFECVASIPGVGVHCGDNATLAEPECDELSSARIPSEDHLI